MSMVYRVLKVEARPPAKSGKPAAQDFEGLKTTELFDKFVQGVDPRSQAEAAAQAWVSARSDRRAIVVAEVQTFWSEAKVQSDRKPESART